MESMHSPKRLRSRSARQWVSLQKKRLSCPQPQSASNALEFVRYWNWGGTWASQTTLYFFKQRWGAVDRPYRYYTRVFNRELLNATPAQLLKEYPYFFVAPFDRLQVPNAS